MQVTQLTLFRPLVEKPSTNGRTSEQEASFQAILAIGRAEVLEQEIIGRDLYPDFTRMVNCSHDRYIHICRLWHKSKGRDLATEHTAFLLSLPSSDVLAPVRRWSLDAKRRNRLIKLHRRMARKYSIPDLFHQAIQVHVLLNPDYYGICPLQSELECRYYPPYRPVQT